MTAIALGVREARRLVLSPVYAFFGAYMVLRLKRPSVRRVVPKGAGQILQPELEYINF